jgi:hypothetical protein
MTLHPSIADALLSARRVSWLLLGFVCMLAVSQARAEPSLQAEYNLKAAYLYNFTKFVSWPAARFANPSAPLVLGIFGSSPFDSTLARAIAERRVDGREIVLRQVASSADARLTHVLFIPAGSERAAASAMTAIRTEAVLTVGETDAFREQGGVIRFVVEDNKLRFVIDAEAVGETGLKISSQLYKLAHQPRPNR